jgi:hypothetical protein
MIKSKKLLSLFLLGLLLISACGPSAEEAAATMAAETVQAGREQTQIVEQAIQETVAAAEAANTQTPTFTLTLTPEPTFTETPIPSPTVVSTVEVTSETATVWEGPGIAFPILMTANKGDTFEVYGRSADGSWLVILVDEAGTKGWISISDIKIEGDIGGLLVMESPPTPTVPTATNSTSTSVKITIINNSSKKVTFLAQDESIKKVINLKPGTETSFELPKGSYYGFVGFGGVFCEKGVFSLTNDLLWLVTDSFTCAQDPLH